MVCPSSWPGSSSSSSRQSSAAFVSHVGKTASRLCGKGCMCLPACLCVCVYMCNCQTNQTELSAIGARFQYGLLVWPPLRQQEADSVAAGDAPCQWDLSARTTVQCVWWDGPQWVGCHLSFGGLSRFGFSLVFRAWPEMPNIDLNQLIRAVVAGITPSNLINFNARLHTQITHMSTHTLTHTRTHKHTHTHKCGLTLPMRQSGTLWQHFS